MISRLTIALTLLTLIIFAPVLPCFEDAAATRAAPQQNGAQEEVVYACPMHPEVTSERAGRCPKCGMDLRVRSAEDGTSAAGRSAADSAGNNANNAAGNGGPITSPRIPDTTVYDQNGRRLKFYTDLVKGKTVAINFIFTTCMTVCPPLSATFRRVQQGLGERLGRDIELISISVDPATDVPERLKSFSEKFKAGPGWTFITGGKPEIDRLLEALGGYVSDKNDHTPLLLIGNDAAHFWTRTYGLAPPSQLINLITEAANKSGTTRAETGREQRATQPPVSKPATDEAAAKYFSNTILLTQDNRPVRFYDDLLKGKVVLINFLFTTCKGVCAPMTANLAKVQKQLGERVGRDVLMISISVDPETDTPAVLKKYADNFKAQPGWYFLTGEKKNVDWVLYKLGGYVEDKQQHNSTLIIGNVATGEWMKVPAMSNPVEIASAVTRLLDTN
ncbi:MAG TPA: SCO family protein [Pyrinomonadaceae bacterium]|jgi:cytochrome oxidase Cu insertion factor (SCO1/SenC/PrrC family)|nr:SCO family protein [Pyrinomonadaceae bacterium]